MIDALAAAAAAPSDTPRATASPADALGETSVHVAVPDDTEPEPPRIIRQAQAERASRQQAAAANGRAIAAQSWRDFAAGVVLSGVAGGVLYGILTTF
ncbi:MAG: hypothetical protein R3D68_10610 [Hyphomicrobiaceae bacterium]